MVPPNSRMLRLAVVQLAPVHGDVRGNIARAQKLLDGARVDRNTRQVDAVLFPEMAFTGYVFDDPEALVPLLEDARALQTVGPLAEQTGLSQVAAPTQDNPGAAQLGLTLAFLRALAHKLDTNVFSGLPLALHPSEPRSSNNVPGDPVYAHGIGSRGEDLYGRGRVKREVGTNSAVVLRRGDGTIAACTHKVNLFRSDVGWAKPGSAFTTHDLPGLGRTCVAICMDLNPGPSAAGADEEVFELAAHCIATRTNVLVLLNAWLHSTASYDGSEDEGTEGEELEDIEDWGTVRYWVHRLRPLYTGPPAGTDEPSEVLVVVCNRAGREGDVTFAGSSALIRCVRGSGRAEVLDVMGAREGVAIWDVRVPA